MATRCKISPRELIVELRSRINPAYIDWLGTQSYERNQCIEALEAQANEIDRLRNMLSESSSLDCGARHDRDVNAIAKKS